VALAVAAILIGSVVGLSLRGGGDKSGQRASGTTSTPKQSAARTSSAAASAAPAGTAAKPAATPPAGGDPVAANDRGFQLLKAQDYAGAVAPLRAAVQGFRDAGRTDELTYYFALYNLGVALNRSGNPAEAIPFLQERLRNPNQQGTVRQELAAAQAQLGGGGKPAKHGKKIKD